MRRKSVWIALGVACVLAVASMADARGFRRYMLLQQDVADLTARNGALREKKERYVREIERLRTDKRALERAAREELGFIKPGEIILNVE